MQPTQLTDAVSNIASKNAQYILNWILIFTIVLGAAGAAWLFKWLVGRLQEQTALLADLFKSATEGRERVATIVAENTAIIRECRDTMCENTEMFRRVKDVIDK